MGEGLLEGMRIYRCRRVGARLRTRFQRAETTETRPSVLQILPPLFFLLERFVRLLLGLLLRLRLGLLFDLLRLLGRLLQILLRRLLGGLLGLLGLLGLALFAGGDVPAFVRVTEM